jgi:hypothetical protein
MDFGVIFCLGGLFTLAAWIGSLFDYTEPNDDWPYNSSGPK